MKNAIRLHRVNLHYASTAFHESSLKTILASALHFRRQKKEIVDIHALKDISLEIMEGERVGLLGHNGAGKSTFLKMVAGLYPISSGSRDVRGVVRSLFDLSLGFEPDATGRENILYRGLLLGLTPKFMRSIEEQIVAFAEIGEFIDYPIKTYSAGMQIRLAFAISTAIGGDILLLDEVVGAGDANFMVKAKKRIMELVDNAEILVLASHDLGTLKSLCKRGVVLHHGGLAFDGPIDEAVTTYRRINGVAA
ncbi:ABC transporter ATP-binding protein [Chelativorans sp. AA-79]|uniref:ABC transporter ATP-binding protein n=1 Tax=Chelativorans sp. AA-79 TaxID=3028735 RepID=UPI0023F7E80D|nr:ABC transporter ATP-binding protein [Chelativorans sp. AA-79]WEX08340.1 ABC transporter ATP-binding protein [Chelativorans sp. AA-79]